MEQTPILPAGASVDAIERFLGLDVPAAPLVAVASALSRFQPNEIGAAVEVLIALLDLKAGDPDVEPNGDEEDSDGDEKGDQAYIEWHTAHPGKRTQCFTAGQEDDEEDDPSGQCDEDGINTELYVLSRKYDGPGCVIGDTDFCTAGDDRVCSGSVMQGGAYVACEHAGSEDDGEIEQMPGDVPMLPVRSFEFNIFTDQRQSLGISNLMSSFVGQGVISADTGAKHSSWPSKEQRKPGVPV